jgi:hypothetical protein
LEQVKKGTDEIMAKYLVFGVACATVSDEVEAHSPEEAVENADLSTGLCHQCSYEVELGDVYEISVVQALHYVLSPAFLPCTVGSGPVMDRAALVRCMELCKEDPRWRLSMQLHKFWAVR